LFAIGAAEAPTVLLRATTSLLKRVQTGANAACTWSAKLLHRGENEEAIAKARER
jgi:hypothetical protein